MIRKGETKNTFFIFIHYVAENKLQIVRHSQKGSRSTDLLTLSLHFTARLHMILHSLKAIAVSWQTACTLSWHDTGCDSGLPIVGRKWHGQKIDLLAYLSLPASVCLLNGKRSSEASNVKSHTDNKGKRSVVSRSWTTAIPGCVYDWWKTRAFPCIHSSALNSKTRPDRI